MNDTTAHLRIAKDEANSQARQMPPKKSDEKIEEKAAVAKDETDQSPVRRGS